MHWGGRYGRQLRRTLHLLYRSFGGNAYPPMRSLHWVEDIRRVLSSSGRAAFEDFIRLFEADIEMRELAFRMMLGRDAKGFKQVLARLHPGATQRMTCVYFLCKLARRTAALKRAQSDGTDPLRALADYPSALRFEQAFAARFSNIEAEALCQRFSRLDALLKDSQVPTTYRFYEAPAGMDVDNFVASWQC